MGIKTKEKKTEALKKVVILYARNAREFKVANSEYPISYIGLERNREMG